MKQVIRKIVWVSPLIIDLHLHKTTQVEILRNLAKRGNRTFLFAMRSTKTFKLQNYPGDGSVEFPKLFLVPIRYFPMIAPAIYTFALTFLLLKNILSLNPDFIIMETDISVMSSIPNMIFTKLRKTKFILDIRSVPVEIEGFRGALNKFWFNVSVLIANGLFSGVTTITPMMKEEICSKFSIDPRKVGVWTSGVSPELFDPDACNAKGNELRAKLGLSGKFVVFYHGNISATRGIIETIEAMKIVLKRHPDTVLFLLGSGPFVTQLKSFIKNDDVHNNVIIHEPVEYPRVPEFISMCDVCIIPLPDYPYWRPQSPLKLFEYLSMEKVVLATDLPAHRSVLGNCECCIYLSSVKPEIIANRIEFASINKDKLSVWGKLGRKIVLCSYTWEKVAEDLEDYFNNID